MKWITWPVQWMKVLPFVAVSGSMIYAALVQWGGDIAWIEALTPYRLIFMVLCLAGTLLFLIGLSLGRVILGAAVSVWLASPLVPYFLPERGPPAPAEAASAPLLTMAVMRLDPGTPGGPLLEALSAIDADLVILGDVAPEIYQESFQYLRERYATHWINTPDEKKPGLWCFTRLSLVRDLSRTRTREAGEPSCDWTLELADGSVFRLTSSLPPEPWRAGNHARRRRALLAIADAAGAHDGPRIVAGPLGLNPFSNLLDEMLANGRLRDTGKGHGFQCTWMPVPPFGLPMDPILVSDHWQVIHRETRAIEKSGNRLLVARLRRVRG